MSTMTKSIYQELIKDAPSPYDGYMELVGDTDINHFLTRQLDKIDDFFDDIPKDKHEYAYQDGKWTPKEILGHLNDCERIFGYRVLRILRGDDTPMPGFDENAYVKSGKFNFFDMEELLDEFHLMRQSNLALFSSVTPKEMKKKGRCNDKDVTAGMLMYVIGGHVLHHQNVIAEKYL